MHETQKTISTWTHEERALVQGHGIDIGCGPDPLPWATIHFDRQHGDANHITNHISQSFDFVYSAHCLEHMIDAKSAFQDWFSLVKPGGHMIIIVPDEDLYEQGVWPSRWNPDHKHSFTISKQQSWSPVSINCIDLCKSLPACDILSIQLQDRGYDRALYQHGHPSRRPAHRVQRWMAQHRLTRRIALRVFGETCRGPMDQTYHGGALAQIQMILRKRP